MFFSSENAWLPTRKVYNQPGYFVVNIENGVILVEHYSYKEKLLRIIEGQDARSIYLTIVRNGWVSNQTRALHRFKHD